ncbi:MAG: ester cyclase [Thermomicrobiales bacterium]
MSVETNKRNVRQFFEEAFNQGRLEIIDTLVAEGSVDHQHPDEPSFRDHLKDVVRSLRAGLPDLHFEITEIIGEGDWVALHAVMTGTHTGALRLPVPSPNGPPVVAPTGRFVRVPHMHMIRFENGQNTELWHIMDTLTLLGQLGLLPTMPSGVAAA